MKSANANAFAATMARIAHVVEASHDSADNCERIWVHVESENGPYEVCVTLELDDDRYSVQNEDGMPRTGYSGADRWDSLYDALWDCGLKDMALAAR